MRRTMRGSLLALVAGAGVAGAVAWRGSLSVRRTAHADAAPPRVTVPSAAERVQATEQQVAVNGRIAALRSAERVQREIERAVLLPWRAAWTARDAAAFARLEAPGSEGMAWASAARTVSRERGGIREAAWTPAAASEAGELARYLGAFASVAHVQLDVVRLDTPSPDAAVARVRFDLRGQETDGGRRQDRGELAVSLRKVAGVWRVASVRPAGALETVSAAAARAPMFEDATAASGLDRVPRVDRREAIRRGGYALAVTDYDGDGRADVLVGNWGAVQLFHNTPQGFVESSREAGLQGESLVKSAAFADLDNDGRPDLVLARFIDTARPLGASRGSVWDGAEGDGDFVAYRNLGGGRFERKGNVLSRHRHYDRSMPIAIADLDGDGRLDVYVGFPGARDFTNDLAHTGGRRDLAHQGVWLNRGDWNFSEGAAMEAEGGGNVDEARVFPHAVLATDLTGDGKPEIVVVDDSGQVSPVYRNDGAGRFRDATREMGVGVAAWGMGATAGDYDGDGAQDLLLTNVAFAGGERMEARVAAEGPGPAADELRHRTQDLVARGMHLFHNRGDGRFDEVTDRAGVTWAGAGAACADWIDYDNDGLLDLYVANGLWSGGPEEAESFFLTLVFDRETRAGTLQDMAMSMPGALGASANPVLSILRNFRGSLDDPRRGPVGATPTLSLAGRQRNRLFRNNGDGTFTDVAFLENADRIEDGYVLAPADIDGDGRQDLVLRNADAPPSQSFPAVVYLHNTGAPQASLAVSLEGVASNRAGVGARVTAVVGGRSLHREIRSVGGAMEGPPVAHFGLAGGAAVASLEVRWPSGRVERFAAPAGPRVTLREGAGTVAAR